MIHKNRVCVLPYHRNHMLVLPHASTIHGTFVYFDSACDLYEQHLGHRLSISFHMSNCIHCLDEWSENKWKHSKSKIRLKFRKKCLSSPILPSDPHVGPSFGALLQSTGHDSRMALVLPQGPTWAKFTAAKPTRHACTRSMHLAFNEKLKFMKFPCNLLTQADQKCTINRCLRLL